MPTNQPTISVVMPVFNANLYVKEAVQSVLNQSFADFEILIFDDCSTDNSYEILSELAQHDSRIKLFKREKNLGLVSNLNDGISKSKGAFIARMDADDICHPERFQKQLDFFKNNQDIDVLGTAFECFGDICKTVLHPFTNEEIKERLFEYCCIGHPTVMFRKSIVTHHELYKKELFPCEDYHLWVELIKKYKFANLKEVLLNYRIHNHQISSERKVQQEELDSYAKVKHFEGRGEGLNSHCEEILLKLVNKKFSVLSFFEVQKAGTEVIKKNTSDHFFDSEMLKEKLRRLIYFGYYNHTLKIDYLLLLRKSNHFIFKPFDFYQLIGLYFRLVMSSLKQFVLKCFKVQ